MFRLLSRLGCTALVLTLAADAACRPADKGRPTGPVLLPGGGVADPAGKAGYFPNTSGGIDALDLASGEVLWKSKEASRPLLATADRLFAQTNVPRKANEVRVAVLDTRRQGARVLLSEPITFPDWVYAGVTYGRSFAATARLDKDSLLLIWEARAWYAGGAAPPPEVEKAARKSAAGVVRVDLQSGHVKALKGDEVPQDVPRRVPGEVQKETLHGKVYSLRDELVPGKTFQRRRFLQAADAAGKVLWRHEIAAPVSLVPLP